MLILDVGRVRFRALAGPYRALPQVVTVVTAPSEAKAYQSRVVCSEGSQLAARRSPW